MLTKCFVICRVHSSQAGQMGIRPTLVKRERNGTDNTGNLMPLGTLESGAFKEASPRILPPPPWLSGNLKVMAQGKVTQIGKRGITDWKSVGTTSKTAVEPSEFLLPNCPGASTSPYKGNKKKLSPMSNLPIDHHFGTPVNRQLYGVLSRNICLQLFFFFEFSEKFFPVIRPRKRDVIKIKQLQM